MEIRVVYATSLNQAVISFISVKKEMACAGETGDGNSLLYFPYLERENIAHCLTMLKKKSATPNDSFAGSSKHHIRHLFSAFTL